MTLIKEIEKDLNKLETKHGIIFFIIIMILTILITRGLVLIKDPHPILLGFEFHHFDYGLFLLILTNLSLLFGKIKYKPAIFLSAVATALIIDDLFFIRRNLNETNIYNSTFSLAIAFSLFIIILIFLVERYGNYKVKKAKRKQSNETN
ncbi:MAG: hypothetical protein Q7S33_05150 [Nanoarchaeota archaeon]|nr:hypothetical protein [Nanoarchaeota archaeon]